jgi:hypothetical protein
MILGFATKISMWLFFHFNSGIPYLQFWNFLALNFEN